MHQCQARLAELLAAPGGPPMLRSAIMGTLRGRADAGILIAQLIDEIEVNAFLGMSTLGL